MGLKQIPECDKCGKIISDNDRYDGNFFGVLTSKDAVVEEVRYEYLHVGCAETLRSLMQNGFKSRRGRKKQGGEDKRKEPAVEKTDNLPFVEDTAEQGEEPPKKKGGAVKPTARDEAYAVINVIYELLLDSDRRNIFTEVMKELGIADAIDVKNLSLGEMNHMIARLNEKSGIQGG